MKPLQLPEVVCFRVTRYCNAACGFCLAPPDGAHPTQDVLEQRIDWVFAHGVHTVHFCGGEPTIHPALTGLIESVHSRGGKSRLTTNGIAVSENLISVLRRHRTEVKVSLHGDRAHHDRMLGRAAFDQATASLGRLLACRVPVTVQTTVVAGGEWVVDWMIDYCRETRVKRLSILPFIPRGSGNLRREEFDLTDSGGRRLRALVAERKKALAGRLEIRWLDFTARPLPVVEADGTVLFEGPTEAADRIVARIPELLAIRAS
jgi:MoaA/NifB/PqqE/SkfB family radical SAM enzyme